MKSLHLHILSDLHLEVDPYFKNPLPDADVLILAGDVTNWRQSGLGPFISEASEHYRKIFFVPGNHEYYGGSIHQMTNDLMIPFTDILINKVVEFEGFRFVGTPLWTDFNQRKYKDIETARRCMNDYRQILGWTPETALLEHNKAVNFLERTDLTGSIVITHHAPSFKSIGDIYANSPLNGSFASDLDSLVIEKSPLLWVHGHCHTSSTYTLGSTRVVCNPKGYFDENPTFNPSLVIEVHHEQ